MLTTKQVRFCNEVANGKTATEAYRISYDNNSEGTCKVNGSKLIKSKKIAEEINRIKDENKSIAIATKIDAASKLAPNSIADAAERMQVLTQIMRGEIKLKKHIVCDGVIEECEVVPDWTDRKNAIAELNKMQGDYAPTKTDISINKAGLDAIEEKYV